MNNLCKKVEQRARVFSGKQLQVHARRFARTGFHGQEKLDMLSVMTQRQTATPLQLVHACASAPLEVMFLACECNACSYVML